MRDYINFIISISLLFTTVTFGFSYAFNTYIPAVNDAAMTTTAYSPLAGADGVAVTADKTSANAAITGPGGTSEPSTINAAADTITANNNISPRTTTTSPSSSSSSSSSIPSPTPSSGLEEEAPYFEFIDGHADTITRAMEKKQSMFSNSLHVDFKRLAAYKSPVQVFTVWCADKYVKNAYDYANTAIDFFEAELAAHSDIIELALTLEDLERNSKNKKISAILALEGGEPLEGKLENINHFYNRGVRLITLTWNRENELGYGVSTNSDKGLKPFGVECVKRMEELGIIVDVSHLNDTGFWDVDKYSARPYMASHSNVYSITPHNRNLKDSQIKAIVDKGGIIGVNLYPDFLDTSGKAGINNIISHINRFIELGALDNIGLGSDFDGFITMPEGFVGVSSFKMLAREITSKVGADASAKIMSKNYYNFFKWYFSYSDE
jgi:membrane dipeptidase